MEFVLAVLASLVAALIWEWYKGLSKFRKKLAKPLDPSNKRIIKRKLRELKRDTEPIIGDLMEEIFNKIQNKEPRWKIAYAIARTMLELSRTLLEEIDDWE